MLSYAQNMEDVLLARLFEGQERGFYIDVGGGHAVADNVTFHFYSRGWRGIVVEPQAALGPLYRRIRPRDVLVQALAGRQEGSLELFEATTFHGLSTASPQHAVAAEQAGVAGRRVSKRLPLWRGSAPTMRRRSSMSSRSTSRGTRPRCWAEPTSRGGGRA